MNEFFSSFPVFYLIRRYMYVVLVKKKSVRYVALFILSSIFLWILSSSDLKDQQRPISSKRGDINGYNFENKKSDDGFIQNNKSWRETHISRRPPRLKNHVRDAETGSNEFRPKHQQVLPPMQRLLQLSGQEFYEHVDDPDFKEMHNFQKYPNHQYLKDYKNPCLYRNVSLGRYTDSPVIKQMRCVPYFMIVGFPKCGTTDLWSTLTKHPDVTWSHPKEVNFFNKKQFAFVPIESAIESYQTMFTASTMNIEKCVSKTNPDFHPCITGDASVDTIFDNKLWRKLPGNEHHAAPVLTNANYVHSVNPNMKIIVLLRDPVERLYSDYLYMSSSIGHVPSPEVFHNTAVDNISNYTACVRHRSRRACAYDMYDDWNIRTYKVRLNIGMYYIFLSDWLKVFARDNVMVVKSEDTRGPNRTRTLIKIFRLLGLGVSSRKEVEKLYNSQKLNERSRKNERMLPKTRKLLTEFYKNFNKELETLLPNIRY